MKARVATKSLANKKRLARYHRGVFAEYVAAIWLQFRAYRILDRRFKTPVGEIDLIAKRGRTLVFVEVKARRTAAEAAAAIHYQNQQRIVRAAQLYLGMHPQWQDYTIRFDAVVIAWYKLPKHIPHAFDAS